MSSASSVTLELKEIPTKQATVERTKPKLGLANDYHAARRGYASSRPVKDKENSNSMIQASAPRNGSRPKTQPKPCATVKSSKIQPRNVLKPKRGLSRDSTKQSYASSSHPKPISKATTSNAASMKTERLLPIAAPIEIIPPQHTAKSGYELLDICRPNDKIPEHGLAEGIEVHLIESIKLCGLRKAREKSITEMVTTLCTHLSDREKDAEKWTKFADKIVIIAAEKLSLSMLEKEAANASIDRFHRNSKAVAIRLVALRQEIITLKGEVDSVKNDTLQVLDEYNEYLDESWMTALKEKLSDHIATVKSKCELKVINAMDEQSAKHNVETTQLESNISMLGDIIKTEREQMSKLNDELNSVSIAVGEEKQKRLVQMEGFDIERQCLNDKLTESDAEIVRLRALLEEEKVSKRNELEAMENRMNSEFDQIEVKVKRSMKLLAESKDKEIEAALSRAREAEQVLSELRDTVLPVISTSEESGEK